jgi:cation transport ATPase
VVLDDHPAWSATRIELAGINSRLAESETDNLLRLVAGAALYMGDERAIALADACQARGLIVRQPPLVALEADRVSIRQGSHTLVLRDDPKTDRKKTAIRGLLVEIDGEPISKLDFRTSSISRVANEVQHLHQLGIQVFLLSSKPAAETETLAQSMGIGLHGGDFSLEEKVRFLQGMKKRDVRVAYVGAGQIAPELAHEAHVTLSFGGPEALHYEGSDLVVLGDRLDGFVQTVDLTRNHKDRIHAACRKSWIPNALCVVGGYVGVLNGITSGIIANIGVNRVYQQSTATLRDMQHPIHYRRIV